MHEYTVVVEFDEEGPGYVVNVPALPCCRTQGRTVEECLDLAKDAIKLHIEDLVACGEPTPEDKIPPELHKVRVAAPPRACSLSTAWRGLG